MPRIWRTTLVAVLLGVIALVPAAAGAINESPPVITYTIDGIAGANGWYRGSAGGNYVVLRWSVSGADNTDCTFAVKIDGPTTGTTRSCSASNAAGPVTATTKLIKIDALPPTDVGGGAARAPDANGWYNHAVSINWHGSDATAGIAACSTATYGGPDAAPATVSGGCTDNAGNTASSAFTLRYDATAPAVSTIEVKSEKNADVVEWKSSSAADTAVVTRSARGSRTERVLFRGAAERFVDKTIRPGVEYHYSVQTYDQAANGSSPVSVVGLPKVVTLGGPAYVPRAAGQPILRWSGVRRATYYHVQLFRHGKRILAAWPRKPELALRPTWVWGGRRYRLAPGRYRWYAWAGFGPRSSASYRLIGKDDFIATRAR